MECNQLAIRQTYLEDVTMESENSKTAKNVFGKKYQHRMNLEGCDLWHLPDCTPCQWTWHGNMFGPKRKHGFPSQTANVDSNSDRRFSSSNVTALKRRCLKFACRIFDLPQRPEVNLEITNHIEWSWAVYPWRSINCVYFSRGTWWHAYRSNLV